MIEILENKKTELLISREVKRQTSSEHDAINLPMRRQCISISLVLIPNTIFPPRHFRSLPTIHHPIHPFPSFFPSQLYAIHAANLTTTASVIIRSNISFYLNVIRKKKI